MKNLVLLISVLFLCINLSAAQSNETVQDKVTTIIQNVLSIEKAKITPDAALKTDLGAEDYDINVIVMTIEFDFNIKIPEDKIKSFVKVKDIITYLSSIKS